MAENLVEKAKAKAEAAAKLKSTAEKDKRALHSLFTLNDAKNSINSYNCDLNANHFLQVHQAGHPRTRTRTILRLILCGMLAY